jgi:hypothetical protein
LTFWRLFCWTLPSVLRPLNDFGCAPAVFAGAPAGFVRLGSFRQEVNEPPESHGGHSDRKSDDDDSGHRACPIVVVAYLKP